MDVNTRATQTASASANYHSVPVEVIPVLCHRQESTLQCDSEPVIPRLRTVAVQTACSATFPRDATTQTSAVGDILSIIIFTGNLARRSDTLVNGLVQHRTTTQTIRTGHIISLQ